MSVPELTILVGFETTTGFGNPFQLNSSTLGLLDTGTLGGIQFSDLTYLAQSVSTTRGRNRESEQFNAGTAVIAFDDPQRVLDPLNEDSPYYPFVGPRNPVEIYADGIQIYQGLITGWNLTYGFTTSGNVTIANCSDVFTVLANQSLNAFSPTAESTGDRINTILTRPEIEYAGPTAIDEGSSTLGAFSIAEGTNVLDYMKTVATSEQGYLFVDAEGTLTFRGRARALNPVASLSFTDDGTGVRYQTLTNKYDDEHLYTYVQAKSPAGAVQIAESPTARAAFSSQQKTDLTLLNSTTDEVQDIADYLLARYENPIIRFTGVATQLAALSTTDQAQLLGVDITDIVAVTKSFDVGDPPAVTQTVITSGVAHEIRPGSHTVRFTFESTDANAYLTLDSAIFGTLNNNLLAF